MNTSLTAKQVLLNNNVQLCRVPKKKRTVCRVINFKCKLEFCSKNRRQFHRISIFRRQVHTMNKTILWNCLKKSNTYTQLNLERIFLRRYVDGIKKGHHLRRWMYEERIAAQITYFNRDCMRAHYEFRFFLVCTIAYFNALSWFGGPYYCMRA